MCSLCLSLKRSGKDRGRGKGAEREREREREGGGGGREGGVYIHIHNIVVVHVVVWRVGVYHVRIDYLRKHSCNALWTL